MAQTQTARTPSRQGLSNGQFVGLLIGLVGLIAVMALAGTAILIANGNLTLPTFGRQVLEAEPLLVQAPVVNVPGAEEAVLTEQQLAAPGTDVVAGEAPAFEMIDMSGGAVEGANTEMGSLWTPPLDRPLVNIVFEDTSGSVDSSFVTAFESPTQAAAYRDYQAQIAANDFSGSPVQVPVHIASGVEIQAIPLDGGGFALDKTLVWDASTREGLSVWKATLIYNIEGTHYYVPPEHAHLLQ